MGISAKYKCGVIKRLTKYRKTICAGVLLYLAAIAFTSALYKNTGSFLSGFGRTSGQYAVTIMSRSLQNLVNFRWLICGETSNCKKKKSEYIQWVMDATTHLPDY